MVLDANDKIENCHCPININMVGNNATKQFEKASIFCSKGNLNTGRSQVRIGAETIQNEMDSCQRLKILYQM